MSYQVTYTESNNPAKPAILVDDGTINNETSVSFVGQGYTGFAPVVANNFLHLLENFASPATNPPSTPVEGQIWYDTTNKVVKVYDGTTWSPAGALRKSLEAPENSVAGDLWVDTSKSQLYVYSGSNWLLIGPQYSSGTQTGPVVDEIVDVDNVVHSVVSIFSNGYRIGIISKDAFTPKAVLAGFSAVKQGFNLSSIDATSSTAATRFWGTASSSDSLLVSNKEVAAANFLRGDTASTTNYTLNVRSDGGISVGSTLAFNIGINGTTTVLSSNSNGNSVDFKLNSDGVLSTVMHLGAVGRVGIGINNTNPSSTLDVDGLITSSGGLTVTNTTDSTLLTNGSIKTAGGLAVAKNSNFGGSITAYGNVVVNNLNNNQEPIAGSVILPGSDAANGLYDIGTSTRKFRNIYAQAFVGSFTGTVNGVVNGNVSGSAAKLASPTTFRLAGDVTSDIKTFDGQGDDPLIFNTAINSGFITSKTLVSDSLLTDTLLAYRESATSLVKMTKDTFLRHVATVPVGSIFPFAGTTVPEGYLLCDGSEVEISRYIQLYRVLGNTYKATALLVGKDTFGLPDYRGRNLLGRDNMDNDIRVPSKTGSGTLIKTIAASANRVTDPNADTMGSGTGSESVALDVKNLPDHKHNLSAGTTQFYAGSPAGAQVQSGTTPGYGLPSSSGGAGLPNSGSVISSIALGQAFNVMNPYATTNFIIFTGEI
jgi:microcystin-dependent protein